VILGRLSTHGVSFFFFFHLIFLLSSFPSAFSIQCEGCSARSYCGYTAANTGFRLALAIATIFLAVAMYVKVFTEKEMLLYFILLIHAVLWFAASMADAVSLTNATMACNDNKFDGGVSNSTCYPNIYGKKYLCVHHNILNFSLWCIFRCIYRY
jgi:hypothetical protein